MDFIRRHLHTSIVAAIFGLALALAGCDDDDNNPVGPNPGGDDTGNNPPTAMVSASPTTVPRADNNQTVVTITAEDSTDPDGDALSFSWTVPSGTFVNGTNNGNETVQVTFPGAAPYTVTVVVSDGNGGSDNAQVTIGLR